MKRVRILWLAALALAGFAFFWLTRGQPSASPKPIESAEKKSSTPGVGSAERHATAAVSLPAMIDRILDRLRVGGVEPGELDALRQRLLSASPDEAIAAIRAFLASGRDALTGEIFAVVTGGDLEGAPTLRVLMLDLLGRISRENSRGDGAEVARALLEKKTSADEWAVALRNVGWSQPRETTYLAGKMHEMLGEKAWRQQPSGGYLEAFDVIVFTRDVTFVKDLTEMITSETDELKRASSVALDRLSAEAPLQVMGYLNQHPQELAEKPFIRADFFAKADLSQSAQRIEVEAYLSRPDVPLKEKNKFLAATLSPGVFVSDNLLTPPPSDEDPPGRIQGLDQTVDQWIKTNRYPELGRTLLQLQEKLRQKPEGN